MTTNGSPHRPRIVPSTSPLMIRKPTPGAVLRSTFIDEDDAPAVPAHSARVSHFALRLRGEVNDGLVPHSKSSAYAGGREDHPLTARVRVGAAEDEPEGFARTRLNRDRAEAAVDRDLDTLAAHIGKGLH